MNIRIKMTFTGVYRDAMRGRYSNDLTPGMILVNVEHLDTLERATRRNMATWRGGGGGVKEDIQHRRFAGLLRPRYYTGAHLAVDRRCNGIQ